MLFLDAKAAIDSSRKVAEILQEELGKDSQWREFQIEEFTTIAKGYTIKD
jgi:glycerol-3-phosphate dehydrogenase